MFRRLTTLLAFASTFVLAGVSPVLAATYPPAIGSGGTEVEGTKVENGVSGSGLPHTGFSPVYLWVALALIVLGAVIIGLTRTRRASQG